MSFPANSGYYLTVSFGNKSAAPPVDARKARCDALVEETKALKDAQRFNEALDKGLQALALDSEDFHALYQIGDLHHILGNMPEAIHFFERAHQIRSNDLETLCELGELLAKSNRFSEAVQRYEQVLRINPDYANGYLGLAMTNYLKGDDAASDAAFDQVLRLRPDSADAFSQYAHMLFARLEFQKAADCYTRSLAIEPGDTTVMSYFGRMRALERKSKEAGELIERALTIDPTNVHALNAKAYWLMIEGDYANAWKLHEYRFGGPGKHGPLFVPEKPVWGGEDISDKTLLILGEQGLGDVLQFVRYAALCRKRAATVYVRCSETLAPLLANCPFIDATFTTTAAPPSFDVQIAVMSLPYIFGTTLETVPAEVPYLFVPDELKKNWSSKLGLQDNRLKVGLVWSGSSFATALRGDIWAGRRNMSLKHLLPLLGRKGIQFVNLQMGDAAREIDEHGLRDRFVDPMPHVKDMQDTAAIVQSLDLVISIDTSIVHLTGGLGKPIWVLSRYDACWRWLKNRPDSPWYPTARIFGQPEPFQWGQVIVDVGTALDALINARG
jgi:cytochrome c-type biogenesis protein CcmH/NrfG